MIACPEVIQWAEKWLPWPEEGDPAFITVALDDIARSVGMTSVAKQAGVTGEALYKALSPEGDPKLTTLLGVAKALGIRLTAAAAVARPARRSTHRAKAGAKHKGRARKLEPAHT